MQQIGTLLSSVSGTSSPTYSIKEEEALHEKLNTENKLTHLLRYSSNNFLVQFLPLGGMNN